MTPFQAVFPPGAKFTKRYTLPEAHVSVATPDVDPNNGDHTFRINVGAPSPGGALKGGVWRLLVRNTSSAPARLDVWTIDGLLSPEVVFSGTSVDDSVKIGSPGSAASAITVASFTTRVQWTDIDGTAQSVGLDLDDISDFSSEGPLRTQVRKPDLAAPGAMIASCLSSHANAERAMTIDNRFQVMAGTSMAAPFITGLVALLLEKDPGLDPSGIKSRLAACATIPGQPQGSFHPKWGNGMIDVNAL